MTGPCGSAAGRVEAYRRERLPEAERRAFRAHLSECDSCRREALAADPTLIFAAAPAPPPVGDAEARAILENVKAAIAVREADRRLRGDGARRGRRSAAALAAAALLALTFSAPLARRRPGVSVARSSPAGIAGTANRILRPGSEEPSMPSSATIYEWNPGTASPDDPKIVWIVDRSLDL